ncbi:MAG: hypothetical protein IPM69_17130 [Ignavibacteria bacterium]|nr:hypothetical protein [Ignavibacteria bacterium]
MRYSVPSGDTPDVNYLPNKHLLSITLAFNISHYSIILHRCTPCRRFSGMCLRSVIATDRAGK